MQDLHTSLCATESKLSQWIVILLFGPHESRFIIKCYASLSHGTILVSKSRSCLAVVQVDLNVFQGEGSSLSPAFVNV
jgi:hypothetical protein